MLFRAECFSTPIQSGVSVSVSLCLRKRIELGSIGEGRIVIPPKIILGDQYIQAPLPLLRFYDYRHYQPVWSDNNGPLSRRVCGLLNVVCQAVRHGLRLRDYHLSPILETLAQIYRELELKEIPSPEKLADLDLLLTDTFYMYCSHLRFGRVNPEEIGEGWFIDRWKADLTETLQNAFDSDMVEETLDSMSPSQPDYLRLKQAFARYRNIAKKGGWSEMPSLPKIMKKGKKGEYVGLLRKRLMIEGDFDQHINNDGNLFDDSLKQAVQRFQKRHGLVADGIVGPDTRGALNIPNKERVRQIELNMERLRWLPEDLGERYILVNIADFCLEVEENEKAVLVMRIVAGKPYTTRIFSARLTYLVLNPYWNIPPGITMEEMLPRIQQDPEYLTRENIKVFQGWDEDMTEIDPATITWDTVSADNFKYRLRQEPGPQNPVGRIKFMFPNRYNIYLHDTPHKHHFAREKRNLSHGCIRVEKPIELAEYLLADPSWTRKKILDTINQKERKMVSLPKPIPLYIVYHTAWVDTNNIVHFRSDIDGRDKVLNEAFNDYDNALSGNGRGN